MSQRRAISEGVGDHPPERRTIVMGSDPLRGGHYVGLDRPASKGWIGATHVKRLAEPVIPVCHEHDAVEPCPRCEQEG